MQGKKFTIEFAAFTKKRIEIERDYAKKLQSLAKSSKVAEIAYVRILSNDNNYDTIFTPRVLVKSKNRPNVLISPINSARAHDTFHAKAVSPPGRWTRHGRP